MLLDFDILNSYNMIIMAYHRMSSNLQPTIGTIRQWSCNNIAIRKNSHMPFQTNIFKSIHPTWRSNMVSFLGGGNQVAQHKPTYPPPMSNQLYFKYQITNHFLYFKQNLSMSDNNSQLALIHSSGLSHHRNRSRKSICSGKNL